MMSDSCAEDLGAGAPAITYSPSMVIAHLSKRTVGITRKSRPLFPITRKGHHRENDIIGHWGGLIWPSRELVVLFGPL
jgi:hypothetical protein